MDPYGAANGGGLAGYDSSAYPASTDYGGQGQGYQMSSSGYYDGGGGGNGSGGNGDRRYDDQGGPPGRYDDAQSDPRNYDRSRSERSNDGRGGDYGAPRGDYGGAGDSYRDSRGGRYSDERSSSAGNGGSDGGSRGRSHDTREFGSPGPSSPAMGRGAGAAGRGNYQFSEGDWPCPNPGMECNRCGTSRPAESRPAGRGKGVRQRDPEKPRSEVPSRGPPFRREGDWACPMCMNINWASRADCNICQTRNPKLAEEKREGRAGGHYERQEIATKAKKKSEDSDEEYDEFGRRKKKRRG